MKTISTLLAICALTTLQASSAAGTTNFTTALGQTALTKTIYAETLQVTELTPKSLSELGLDESYLYSSLIKHVDIDPVSGAVMVGLAPEFGQNEWLALIPKVENGNISYWTCQTTVDSSVASGTDCRSNVAFENITTVLSPNLFSETLIHTLSIKLNVNDIFVSELQFPQRMDELGVGLRWLQDANVDHVLVEPHTKSILFGLSNIYGANEWLVFDATVTRYGTLSWACKTSLPRAVANVSGCRSDVKLEDML